MGSRVIGRGRHGAPWFLLIVLLALPLRADAHRLDELLQATRVSVDVDRIRVEMALTPGVDVADPLVDAIDTDGNGRISDGEARAYASAVLRAIRVSIDGRAAALQPDVCLFPSPSEMREGVGTIRLTSTVHVPQTFGRHRLAFSNAYEPAISAYLVNALVPTDPRVQVIGQQRDPSQRTYTLEYDVAGSRAWIGWSGAATAMVAVLIAGRRRSRRAHPTS